MFASVCKFMEQKGKLGSVGETELCPQQNGELTASKIHVCVHGKGQQSKIAAMLSTIPMIANKRNSGWLSMGATDVNRTTPEKFV